MSSIGGFDTFGASGALSILNSTGSSGGIFGALTGGATPSPSISALGVSNPLGSAGQTIQQITQNQSVQTQKNNIYKIISDRINAISTGQLKPSADWEKLGGYYAAQGRPFVISLSSKGQPVITPQDQMDASHYSVTQRNKLGDAVGKLLNMAPQVQANTNYDNLKSQWDSISVNLVDIKNHNMVPTTDWQQQAATILASNNPISFSLTPDGKVSVEDQTVSTFQDQDPAVRGVLMKASRIAGDAVSTDIAYNQYLAKGLDPPQAIQDKETQYSQMSWVQEASSYAAIGIPYTLGVDTSQIDTSINYVTKTEKTTYSNGLPNATNSFTINSNGTDGYGYPDTTTDAASPKPFAAGNSITTTIAGITDGAGSPISPIKYTNPVNVTSSAANALTVTDTVTGNTDNFAYDGAGTLTVTSTNKQGAQIGQNTYNATGLSAIASQPPTVSLVDGSGKAILTPGSGRPVSYSNAVTVNKIDQNNMTVTNSANGNVDTYSAQLDGSNNPVQDAKGNYLLSVTHTDSLGRTIGAPQTLAALSPGVNGLVSSTTNPMTIAANGAGTTTAISNQTILPMDKYSTAAGSNGNKLSNVITDGSGKTLGTYTNPVSLARDGAGNITVTDKLSGNVDTFVDNGDNTISVSHKDSAGDVVGTGSTVAGAGLNAIVAEPQTLSFTDGSGNAILATNGAPIPSYSNPVTFTDTSTSPDKSFKVTDNVSGYYDTYNYTDSTGTLSVGHFDKQGNQLYTQTANGVTGFAAKASPLTITDSSGGALTDTLGAAAPTYTSPVTVKDSGAGNFSITDSSTGYVDQYAYDSQANTLTITHSDNASNVLSTQSFTGLSGVGKPWTSMADANSSSWAVTSMPDGVTDSLGGTLTDTLGSAAPTYTNPVTVKDSGGGKFSVTDSVTGYVDQYAYDSTAQTLGVTRNDNAGNTLSTQSFTGVSGIAGLNIPAASLQPNAPTTWDVFNKTTLNSQLTSISSYSTSYDTSTFDMTNPATHVNTPAAYTSNTTFSYTSNNVTDPTLMRSALPNLQLSYVTSPKITVTPVTQLKMPASVEAATPPYDLSAHSMPKWQSDAMGYMKAGTPFMLDFDQQGNLVAKKLTGDNVVKFNNPQLGGSSYNPNAQTSQSTGLSGVALMLSTVA